MPIPRFAEIREAIKQAGTMFGLTVGGAADYGRALYDESYVMPACFVVRSEDKAERNLQGGDGIDQEMDRGFDVIILLSNDRDRLGQDAVDDALERAEEEIMHAVLNYTPTWSTRPIEFAGGGLEGINRARMWWSFAFSCPAYLTTEDGRPFGAGVDLTQVNGKHTVHPHESGTDAEDKVFPISGTLLTPDPEVIMGSGGEALVENVE